MTAPNRYTSPVLTKLPLTPITNNPELKRLLEPIHTALIEVLGSGANGISCSLTTDAAIGAPGIVIFPNFAFPGGHNDGNMFDIATGNCTVPSAGNYLILFSGNGTITGSPGPLEIQLLLNAGVVTTRVHNGNDIGGASEIGIQIVLRLAPGDIININILTVINNALAAGATFSMTRLTS